MDNRRINFHSSIIQVASIIKNKDKIKNNERTRRETKKRERSANYSRQETNKLIELLLMKKDIIENKGLDSDSLYEKDNAWNEIEKEFNKNLGKDDTYRSKNSLKLKFKNTTRSIKQKWINCLEENNETTAKKPKFSSAEKKLIDLMLQPLEGLSFTEVNDEDTAYISDSDDVSIVSGETASDYENIANVKEEEIIIEENKESDIITEEDITNKELPDGYEITQNLKQDPLVGTSSDQSEFKHTKIAKSFIDDEVHKNPCPPMNFSYLLKYLQTTELSGVKNSALNAEVTKKRLEIEILKEELEMKKIQRKMLEQEMHQKNAIHELEKAHLLLKLKMRKDTL